MPLTAQQLRQSRPRQLKMISVPAWSVDGDDQVCIAVLTGADSAELMAQSKDGPGVTADYIVAFVARALIDPDTHERVFDDEHLDALRALPGAGLRDVFNEAVAFNGLGAEALKDAAKNCDPTASDASGSDSPSTPDSSTPA